MAEAKKIAEGIADDDSSTSSLSTAHGEDDPATSDRDDPARPLRSRVSSVSSRPPGPSDATAVSRRFSSTGDDWDHLDLEVDLADPLDWIDAFHWLDDERPLHVFEGVVWIKIEITRPGKLLLSTHHLYFHSEDKSRRWRLGSLTGVRGMQYIMKPNAVELSFCDGKELFFSFTEERNGRDIFHAKLRNCQVPLLHFTKSLSPRVNFKKSNVTELWRRRMISNFDYIIYLNRVAGRTYNDLSQYPVFPWIIADYESPTLDLNSPHIFRDLSKPVGALNPTRLGSLLERYHNLDGFPEHEKFLYGSHYSSPGAVLHFLIRQEPFTTLFVQLQSGRFDCPDRLFFSLASCWASCLNSSSDVKELVPEFFTLPEIFMNTNKFPLGELQDGKGSVDDVKLPAWARGSAHEFVRVHRVALESEYVSQNIRQWIDLIFGHKQRGQEALEANNLFTYLSYDGAVDIDKITDEVTRRATEAHILNFGHCPTQLLTSKDGPHPARYPRSECWVPICRDAWKLKDLRCFTPSKQFLRKSAEEGIFKIWSLIDRVMVLYSDFSLATYHWSLQENGTIPFTFRGDKINLLGCGGVFLNKPISPKILKGDAAAPAARGTSTDRCIHNISNWSVSFTADDDRSISTAGVRPLSMYEGGGNGVFPGRIVTCGEYYDNTVKIYNAESLKLECSSKGCHQGQITCLDIGDDGVIFVTGGADCTVQVWVIDNPPLAHGLVDSFVLTLFGKRFGESILQVVHVLWGHVNPISCVSINSSLDLAVSGSIDGKICIHNFRTGKYIRSIDIVEVLKKDKETGSTSPAVCKLCISSYGDIVALMSDRFLHRFSVNGFHLASYDAGETIHVMEISSFGEMLVTGGSRGILSIRTLHDLQVYHEIDLSNHGHIRCFEFSTPWTIPTQQYLFVGSSDGFVSVILEPSRRLDLLNSSMSGLGLWN
uniref:BEACH domain-containing protein n=1 Tax=Corethron hystrix TaxID=216773 RepID=A0A7S1BZH1_9STRA